MRFAPKRTVESIPPDTLSETFGIPYTHRTADPNQLPEALRPRVVWVCNEICNLSEMGQWIYIHGPSKTGKSKAAALICREAILRQASAWFYSTTQLMLDRRMLIPEVLVFDDFGPGPLTHGIFVLVKARCEDGKITVLVSQQPPSVWEKTFFSQIQGSMVGVPTC